MDVFNFVLYIIVGALAGLSSGLLGIAGGTIIVPSLLFIYKYQNLSPDFTMQLAAGTSLATMVLTTLISFRSHIRFGADVWGIVRKFLPGIIVGTICGSVIAHFLHTGILKTLFGVFLMLIALRVLFAYNPRPERGLPGRVGMTVVGFVISGISALLGLAGGTLTIPFLLWCNVYIKNAVAASLACSFVIALVGAISYVISGYHVAELPRWSFGYIYLPAFLGIVLASPLCAVFGAYLAQRVNAVLLRKIFGTVLLIVAVKMVC